MTGYTLRNFPYPVYPLIAIIGGALGGSAWYLARLASRPDVIWARSSNPTPWLSVKQNETIKLYNPNGTFASKWSRESL